MRRIEVTNKYKCDVRRISGGQMSANELDAELSPVIAALALDVTLPESKHDHGLTGDWNGFRECHIKPDLLLIYQKPDANTLALVRLGSHAELLGKRKKR